MYSPDILRLKQELKEDEALLLNKTLQLTGLLRLCDTSPELQDTIKLLAEMEKLSLIVKSTKSPLKLISSSSIADIEKTVDTFKLAKMLSEFGLPRFLPNKQDVLEYIDSFELHLQSIPIYSS